MNEFIILVDEQDNEIGYGEKLEIHQKHLLHRAFSIFIFDWTNRKMLLQKRARSKYHSGGLWTNACCSHPRMNESMDNCINKRLKEELGINTHIHVIDPNEYELLIDGDEVIYSCGKFKYYAPFKDLGEYEIDHVFLYSPITDQLSKVSFVFNETEVEELKWVTIEELRTWMDRSPLEFTVWFKKAFELAYEVLHRQARNIDTFL